MWYQIYKADYCLKHFKLICYCSGYSTGSLIKEHTDRQEYISDFYSKHGDRNQVQWADTGFFQRGLELDVYKKIWKNIKNKNFKKNGWGPKKSLLWSMPDFCYNNQLLRWSLCISNVFYAILVIIYRVDRKIFRGLSTL